MDHSQQHAIVEVSYWLAFMTGLLGSGRAAMGPLAPLLPVGVTATMGELHELVGNLLIGLIVIHILGVIAEWLMTGQKLVSAMVHGRKCALDNAPD